jgi:hypothetical protein
MRVLEWCTGAAGLLPEKKKGGKRRGAPPPGVGCCWVDPFRNWVSVSRGSGFGGAAEAVMRWEYHGVEAEVNPIVG